MNKGKHSSSKTSNNEVIQMEDIFSSSNKKIKDKSIFLKIAFIALIVQAIIMAGSTIYIGTVAFIPIKYVFLLIPIELSIICMQLVLIFQKKLYLLLQAVFMTITTIYIKVIGLLPNKFILLLAAVEAFVALILLLVISLKGKKRKKLVLRIISLVLTVVVLFVSYFGVSYIRTGQSGIDDITIDEGEYETPPITAEVTKEPFFIYLSGSDTRKVENIPEKGLSDVNMVIAVDPVKHKMLMVNTPRDYYVALDGDSNKMDKLTHAGSKGIECSMKTLESLYDIKFNYYVKVNFKSLVDIVDALGGITVNSEKSFSSRHSLSKKTYSFTKGANKLTGDAALAFARERKAFAEGDRQRGKNQQLVISAIVDKAISPSILNPSKFREILQSVTKNTKTNISKKEIEAIFKMQLNDMSGWKIDSISVDGTGSSKYTYSYPSQALYVMIPDEETVNSAKTALKAFM